MLACRQGVAKALLQASEALVRDVQQPAIYLHAMQKDMPAVSLYEAVGFATVDTEPVWAQVLGGGKPARVLMCKQLW